MRDTKAAAVVAAAAAGLAAAAATATAADFWNPTRTEDMRELMDTRRLLPLPLLLLLDLLLPMLLLLLLVLLLPLLLLTEVPKAPPGTKTAGHGRTNRQQNRIEKLSNVTSGILLELKT